MDGITTIFVGFGRIAEFVFGVFDGIEGLTGPVAFLLVATLLVGWGLGLQRSERGRARYETKQAKDKRNEYRRNGF